MATEDIRNALPPTTGYEEALLKESAHGALTQPSAPPAVTQLNSDRRLFGATERVDRAAKSAATKTTCTPGALARIVR